jgi:hypothetical protein
MNQDEIIEMARKAGFKMENSAAIQAAEIFAKLVAQRTWVGLFDEEIWQIATGCTNGGDLHADKFARAIEAKLKERNT